MSHSALVDSPYAWTRLVISLTASIIGGVGLWSSVVVLPAIEAEFGVSRGGASFPYMMTMVGFAAGGIVMGRLVDRLGIMPPIMFGAVMLSAGYVLSAFATEMWQFVLCQALLIGALGSSPTFAPLVADISHWFLKRRGLAVAIIASGNYLSGTIWPFFIQAGIDSIGWRETHMWIGIICLVTLIPLAYMLRHRPEIDQGAAPVAAKASLAMPAPPKVLISILVLAGISCCVAMSMPQVHIIAYCGDLGYGFEAGAEMLSLMLGLGVVSRLISGWLSDKIGGIGVLILGSTLQAMALVFYLPFDGLVSLYVISAMFGLAQGGIVPAYAVIVREYFPARQAGSYVSLVLMSTVFGMAVGGWLSGEIYGLTGSYQAAFLNGIAWNFLNMAIAFWLLWSRNRDRYNAQPA